MLTFTLVTLRSTLEIALVQLILFYYWAGTKRLVLCCSNVHLSAYIVEEDYALHQRSCSHVPKVLHDVCFMAMLFAIAHSGTIIKSIHKSLYMVSSYSLKNRVVIVLCVVGINCITKWIRQTQ